MNNRIINFPQIVKSKAVSLTIRPVTHTAELEVNRASMKEIPAVVVKGKQSSNVPIIIILK